MCLGHFEELDKDVFNNDVQTLIAMGFKEHIAKYALLREGDVSAASIFAANNLKNEQSIKHIPKIKRLESAEITNIWIDEKNSNNNNGTDLKFLKEYEVLKNEIMINNNIMCSSKISNIAKIIQNEIQNMPLELHFDRVAKEAVQLAFNVKNACQYIHLPGISEGNMFEGLVGFYQHLSAYQRPLFHAVLRGTIMFVNEKILEIFELQQVIGYARRGYTECNARRRWVFCSLLKKYGTNLSSINKKSNNSNDNNNNNNSKKDGGTKILTDALIDYIEEVKEKAFYTVFIYPSIEAFQQKGDWAMAGDTDVHGANSYLAILLSTLGIRMSRQPLLHDELKGVIQFRDCQGNYEDVWLKRLWDDNNFGKGSGSFLNCRKDIERYPRSNVFCFGYASCPADLANKAVDPSKENKSNRLILANDYLKQFVHYFTGEFLSKKMVNFILQDEQLTHIANEIINNSNTNSGSGINKNSAFREYVWEEDDDMNYTFNLENAINFFKHLNICKADYGEEFNNNKK